MQAAVLPEVIAPPDVVPTVRLPRFLAARLTRRDGRGASYGVGTHDPRFCTAKKREALREWAKPDEHAGTHFRPPLALASGSSPPGKLPGRPDHAQSC
jgi:hypothetical protein